MKNLLSIIVLLGVMMIMVSCGDDAVTPDNDATISGVSASASIDNLGSYGPITVTIGAADGLLGLVVTKDGTALDAVDYTNETSADYTFEYTAVAADENKNIVFILTVTDKDGDTESATLVLSVGSAPVAIANEIKSGLLTVNETWTADRIYELAGKVVVPDGLTLTIEPGTIIKGQEGDGSLATALVVARGGKLMAVGTAEKPIIFTTILDNIQVGESAGSNLNETNAGNWGGIVILGKAPISASAAEIQIEGIAADDTFGLYGGTVSDDNSGNIQYISIRHGGTSITANSEINGLTLGGVGSGTTISYVEVIGNADDGIEFFGGSVNVSNALVWAQGDDAFDIDQAYSGTVDNFVFVGGADSDHGLEIDGPEGAALGKFMMTNGSLKGFNPGGEYADFRDGAQGTISNTLFFNFSDNSDLELDNDGVAANYINGDLVFSGLEFDVSHLTTGNRTIDAIMVDKSTAGDAFTQVTNNAAVVTTATVGADISKFAWTYAQAKGALTGF
jgi:hypothetical protein